MSASWTEGVVLVEPVIEEDEERDDDEYCLWHIFRNDETIALCGYKLDPLDHYERDATIDADTCVVCVALAEGVDWEDGPY